MGFTVEQGSEKGSQKRFEKGVSKRHPMFREFNTTMVPLVNHPFARVTPAIFVVFVVTISFNLMPHFYVWELVDPVVADPVAQDNDKRNDIQIYSGIPYQSTQREGTKLPNIHILSLSCRTGSETIGSTGCQYFLSFHLWFVCYSQWGNRKKRPSPISGREGTVKITNKSIFHDKQKKTNRN